MKSLINEGIQGNVSADTVVVGRGSHATKTVYLERREKPVEPESLQGASNHQVFLSYRRADSAGIVGRIYDRLISELGPSRVFRDVDNIPFGVNFLGYLESVIRRCTVLLVIIGQDWLTASTPNGLRRLDDPSDVVRIEIESALQYKLLVVPLLVNGAVMPLANHLPTSLQSITSCNGTTIRIDPDFHTDMSRLLRRLGSPVV
jgi:hypothetical protein